jgi:general secretion pathway protein D
MVFEALSRTTGLNVILDRDVRADLKTTIFVKDAAVEDTVDLILLQNQLEKRSINANTLFIYPATAAKQKEYQDLQVRSFQIANADVKYLQTLLKTVLKIKDVSVDERSSTLVMRDTPDAIAVAAKVIAAHDVPEPEIMLEVEVLEISHDRLTNLGIQFPDSISFSTPSPAGGLTVNALRAITGNDLLVTPLALGINLKLQDTDANILASPRIRARNKEKARILIGDRVPIITNSVTPVQSGGGVVTGSVQYQDVGLKLEFEPQVYNEQEVGIRIALEVSSIVKEIAGPNGSLAYQIGTRNANTVVRLLDGETQILGGLISSGDRNTASKIPGLGHLPVVGKLFGNNSGTDNKTEIVLSITPRILRAPAVLDASIRNVFSGTEGSMRERALQLDPIGAVGMQSTGSSTPATTPPQRGSARPAPPQIPGPASTNRAPVAPPSTPTPRPPQTPTSGPNNDANTAPTAGGTEPVNPSASIPSDPPKDTQATQ